MSTNEYPFSDDPGVFGNNFNGAQLYAFSKAALAAGAATVNVVQFENLVLGDGTPGFTVWPAQVPDNRYATRDNGTEYAGGRLYGALDTIANVAGNIKAASAFFVVDPVAKRVTRQGYVGVAGNNVNYPAIAVLPSGKGVMAFTLVGGNHYPSAGYARLNDGNVGAVHIAGRGSTPRTASASTCSSTAPAPTRHRRGPAGVTTARP